MRILRVQPKRDKPDRYNYDINYGVLDEIRSDIVTLEHFDKNLNEYDIVFLPMHSRWRGYEKLLNKIKHHKIKSVMFDNDSCYSDFSSSFYRGIDFIFYRYYDSRSQVPDNGAQLLWSVDPDKLKPVYGGNGIAFNCTVNRSYPIRERIARIIKPTKLIGSDYIKKIQSSSAAIHTNSKILKYVRAKILEFAACGTHIISNRSEGMELYFPDNLITYFTTIDELKNILKSFQPDISIQKQLREITETCHAHKHRAEFIINQMDELLCGE